MKESTSSQKKATLIRFKSIYIKFPELPVNDCDKTHLNSSKGKVVLGGRPGLNVTTKKNIEKLMRNEPNFLSRPIFNYSIFFKFTFHWL